MTKILAIACASLLLIGAIGIVSWRLLAKGKTPIAADSSITASPDPVDFAGQALGTTSGIRTVTVGNTDRSIPVSIGSVELSGAGNSDFAIDTNICKEVTIPPGQSCSIDVSFAPRKPGTVEAALVIHRVDAPRTLTVTLTGNGISQPLTVQPTRIDFGQISVNATSVAKSIAATNVTGKPVVMQGVALVGDNAQDFSLTPPGPSGCAGITLAPGSTCVVSVMFSPTDFGDRTASLAYRYQGAGTPLVVAVSGVGATLSLRVTPLYVAFGRQQVHTASASSVATIGTPAGTVVTIGSVAIAGPGASQFKIVTDNCSGQTLAPRASCTVAVEFAPNVVGSLTAALGVIRDNEATAVTAVQLTGIGFIPG